MSGVRCQDSKVQRFTRTLEAHKPMAAPEATKVRGSAFKVSFPHDSRLCCLAHCILTPTFPSQRYRFVVKPGAFNSEPRTLNPEPFLLFFAFFALLYFQLLLILI